MNITDDYVSEANSTQSVHDIFSNCTDNENDNINIFIKYLLLSILSSLLLLSLISSTIWTMITPLMRAQITLWIILNPING